MRRRRLKNGDSREDLNSEEQPCRSGKLALSPEVIDGYMWNFVNFAVVLAIGVATLRFARMIEDDVDWKLEQLRVSKRHEIEDCIENYRLNECSPDLRVPELEADCKFWERCMARNEYETDLIQHSARLWAQTLAEVLNSFVASISYRSLGFILLSVTVVIAVMNFTFGSYRVYHYNGSGQLTKS